MVDEIRRLEKRVRSWFNAYEKTFHDVLSGKRLVRCRRGYHLDNPTNQGYERKSQKGRIFLLVISYDINLFLQGTA